MRLNHAILLACALLIAGCTDELPPKASGKQLFEHYCANCHKVTGQGNFFKGIPANASTRMSKADIVRLIRTGEEGLEDMPVFSDMSYRDAVLISAYLKDQLSQ